MNFNLRFEKLNKKNYQSKRYGKILTVRLPCNPIFPIGPIYLADHIHCLLYTSPSPRDGRISRMPSSA